MILIQGEGLSEAGLSRSRLKTLAINQSEITFWDMKDYFMLANVYYLQSFILANTSSCNSAVRRDRVRLVGIDVGINMFKNVY